MSQQFNFESEMSSVLKLDAPLMKGPQMRWQRKMNENKSENESLLNASINSSACTSLAKTPMKTLNRSFGLNVPGVSKTPCKTPNKNGMKTPGKGRSTPGNRSPTTSGDRFIPNRNSSQLDLGHFLVTNIATEAENVHSEMLSPSKKEFQQLMSENLNNGDITQCKILSYNSKAPNAPEGYQNNLKVLYSQSKTPGSCKKPTRHIPQVPERILDAPEVLDDYYLNLLDWSCNNYLAVCLAGHIYLWNAKSGDIQQLLELENPDEYVSSVAWVKEGNYLAVGTSNAEVQLWDVENQKRLRSMRGHSARVGALAWNAHVLSSGSRSGYIHHHDVRVANHQISSLEGHTQEVCGLKWSPDGKYLASGGNDNLLNIWQAVAGQCYSNSEPVHSFSQHQAAVKAIAWCPWQPSLLATGGGTADRHIRFWNCNTGNCVTSVDTKSQVCSILWSKEYRELISGHGFAHNQLIIWKYPSLTKVAELTGHTSRILHMAMSPDGSTVVSAAADETLRLWKCFAVDSLKKKDTTVSSKKGYSTSLLAKNIR